MARIIYFIYIFSLLTGIMLSIKFFTNCFDMLFFSLIPFLIMGVIGSIFFIWLLKENSNKICEVFESLLDIIPIGYFILLLLALG